VLSKNAKVETIRRVPLFAGCSKRELEEVALIADELRFEPGATLIRQGASGREFIVVIEGDVEVEKDGKPVTQGADDEKFFGEIALITGGPRNATVTTTSPVRALVITDRAFTRLLRDSPQIQAKVMKSLAERLESSAL
jgi:CRP-like cAMP-binding protein